MGVFFIDTDTGQVATRRQLIEVAAATEEQPPARPWLRIQAPEDASTLWYAVMRRRTRGVYIGMLCIRHGAHHASLLQRGWEEVAVGDIGPAPARDDAG